jgi:hypothetical protein
VRRVAVLDPTVSEWTQVTRAVILRGRCTVSSTGATEGQRLRTTDQV